MRADDESPRGASRRSVVSTGVTDRADASGSVQVATERYAVELDPAHKDRGAFFTPAEMADFLVSECVLDADAKVFEPSCGDAEFLTSAARRLRDLGAEDPALFGVEVDGPSAAFAQERLSREGVSADIRQGDFFEVEPRRRYDAVVGNPPYVRYQGWTGEARDVSKRVAASFGVELTNLASSWAAFTVAASGHVAPGGALGLVLPGELLTTNYAKPVREFLLQAFESVRVYLFAERVFPGVSEEVVLLVARRPREVKKGRWSSLQVVQLQNLSELDSAHDPARAVERDVRSDWMDALVDPRPLSLLRELQESGAFTTLQEWGDTTLGMVTGNNKWFTLTPEDAADFDPRDLVRISPPGSVHLRLLTLDHERWKRLGDEGRATLLFRPRGSSIDELDEAARARESHGREHEVDRAYKCRVRKVWWQTPLVETSDILLTYMSDHAPQLCANFARVKHLNSVHGVKLKPELRELGMRTLPVAALNSATLLGAEIVGRSYGGGLLKLEPKEADRLPVVSPATATELRAHSEGLSRTVSAHLAAGNLVQAVEAVDQALLIDTLGMPNEDVAELHAAWRRLTVRRRTRSKS